MADEETDEEEVPASGNGKLLIIVVVVNMVVVLGAAGAVFFAMQGQAQPAAAAEPEVEEPDTIGPLVSLDSIVVNLDESQATHYLRASFQIEVVDAEHQPQVEERLVPIRNAVILFLSSLSVEDTQGEEAREIVLDTILELGNEALGSELIRRVYFTEFVVQ